MEDVEWINEDDVDTADLHIPANKQTSGLPFADKENIDIPWEWFYAELTFLLCGPIVECQTYSINRKFWRLLLFGMFVEWL